MIKNYFKIAWRILSKNKVFSIINILSLSLGISSCIVIYLITSYEFRFDAFHPDKERVYRIMGDVTESTGDKLHFAKVPLAVSYAARTNISGSQITGAIVPYNAKIKIPDDNRVAKQFESKIIGTNYITTVIAEPEYFDIFQYDWLAGNANQALKSPFLVVLTESKARQYFGAGALHTIIGKKIIYGDSLVVTVSGIIEDWNKNTDLAFTDFISVSTIRSSFLNNNISSSSWGQDAMSAWVFMKLPKGSMPSQMNAQMQSLVRTNNDSQTKLSLWLEPLSEIHFNADVIENPIRTADKTTLYTLMAIALFILLLAIINFINLSTAQSMHRIKEVGVRKVMGSSRINLLIQFLSETFVLTFFAVVLAVLLVNPILTVFQSFIPEGITFNFFEPFTLVFLLLIMISTSIFAGLYPAKILSSHLPITGLKSTGAQKGKEKWLLRKGLIVFQFSVSLVFIIGSVVISNQLRYIREKDLGFTADAVITLETPRGDSASKILVLAQEIREISTVNKVALQWLSPMTDNPRGMKLKFKSTDEKDFWVTQVAGNEEFIPLYQLRLLAGRNLVKSDSVNEFVINESLLQLTGNKSPEEIIGKVLYWNDKPYPVVGVVADFHTSSLHDPITPICIINRTERQGALAIKLASNGKKSGLIKTSISQIEKIWKQIYPSVAFDYRFYDESLALLYQKDRQTAMLMNTSMSITIFISCIGLFGLALFTAQKRAKEISIRKILGASIANIAMLLSKDFVVLVIIALFIASPVAWYFMNQWLQEFTYRIHIGVWVFVLSGIAAILIALFTVSFQAIKAAIANPVKNLRNE